MKVVLKGVRLAFANIWEPKVFGNDAKAEPRCSAALLMDPKTQKEMVGKVVEAIQTVAKEKWGVKAPDILKSIKAKGDACLHAGETKAEYDGFEGMVFVSAANKARPVVLDTDKSPLTQADGRPYSGCYVNVSIDVWAQDNSFGKRVNAKLLAIQFFKDGEAFSGGENYADTDFDDESEGGGAGGGDPFDDAPGDDGFF